MDYDAESLPAQIRALNQGLILTILKEIPGQKDLVIEPEMITQLDLVCGVSLLKNAGVEKIYRLEGSSSTPGTRNSCCFMVRASLMNIKTVVDLINADDCSGRNHLQYHLLCIPRLTSICEQAIEAGGVFGKIEILECPLLMYPLDVDVISLQEKDFFTETFLHKDKTRLHDIAHSIIQLEKIAGQVPRIFGQGEVSKEVLELYEYLSAEEVTSKKEAVITDLVVVDRDVDFVSLLLSQLNYEGVLDETFGIDCGKVFLPGEIVPPNGSKHPLNSTDPVFSETRDCHLSAALLKLKEKGADLRQMHSSRQNMDLNAIKDFVASELKTVQVQYKSLNLHVSTCESIMKLKKERNFSDQLQVERNIIEAANMKDVFSFIETFVIRQVCPLMSLRLMSLISITQDGLSWKQYRFFSKLFAQSFGHEHIVTFFNLRKLKLFYESPSTLFDSSALTLNTSKKAKFRETVKKLGLIPRTTNDLKNPEDASFVFGGAYLPVICAILHSVVASKGAAFPGNTQPTLDLNDMSKCLSGQGSSRIFNRNIGSNSSQDISSSRPSSTRVIAVYFVGGVTFAEISAIRFWSRKKDIKVVVLTTGLLNGNSVMKSLMAIK